MDSTLETKDILQRIKTDINNCVDGLDTVQNKTNFMDDTQKNVDEPKDEDTSESSEDGYDGCLLNCSGIVSDREPFYRKYLLSYFDTPMKKKVCTTLGVILLSATCVGGYFIYRRR